MATWIASSCIACCIFHIISIPFNCSDTTLGVTKAITGAKVISLVFRLVAFFLEFRTRTRPEDLCLFFNLGKRA